MEKTVSFLNEKGHKLFGILHQPSSNGGKKVGIILLNTGLQYRPIWHGFNVKLARFLTLLGYSVLRFDTHGIGDSEGEIDSVNSIKAEDFHDAIQTGLFVSDTNLAISFFKNQTGVEDLFLIGPCGGALTSMIAASQDTRIKGVAYIAGPINLQSSEFTLTMHPRDAKKALAIRIRKVCDPRAIYRFLKGSSDRKIVFEAFKVRMQTILNKGSFLREQKDDMTEKGLLFNWVFLEAFKSFSSRGGRTLFLMPEDDRGTWGFRELFEKRYLTPGNEFQGSFQLHYVPKANHIFALEESQRYVFENVTFWLSEMCSDINVNTQC